MGVFDRTPESVNFLRVLSAETACNIPVSCPCVFALKQFPSVQNCCVSQLTPEDFCSFLQEYSNSKYPQLGSSLVAPVPSTHDFLTSEHSGRAVIEVQEFKTAGCAQSLKQYDASGSKVAAVIAVNQLVDVEYDGVDFVLLDPLPVAAMPLSALQLPVIDKSIGMMPVAATAVAGNGGTVSLAAGTAFTLGTEVTAGVSAFTQNCASAVWTSPALVANAEYFLRAQFVAGVLTFYVQRGTLADTEPASRTGTVNGASGGGFYSTTLDICLARIVTGAAGTTPSVQKVINRRSISWSATLNGSGTIYLPIDPFTRTGRITSSNPTPHATLITAISHGSAGWTGASYWYGAPTGASGSTPMAASSLNWVANAAIIINSNNYVGDMTVSTCAGMFDHASKNSMWQVFQSEHCLNDAAGTYGDENLLGMGTKNMLQADYDNGLAVSYSNCVNALLTWEIVR